MSSENSTDETPGGGKAEGETADRPVGLAEMMRWLEKMAKAQPETVVDGRLLRKSVNIQAAAALRAGFVRNAVKHAHRMQEFLQAMAWIIEKMRPAKTRRPYSSRSKRRTNWGTPSTRRA